MPRAGVCVGCKRMKPITTLRRGRCPDCARQREAERAKRRLSLIGGPGREQFEAILPEQGPQMIEWNPAIEAMLNIAHLRARPPRRSDPHAGVRIQTRVRTRTTPREHRPRQTRRSTRAGPSSDDPSDPDDIDALLAPVWARLKAWSATSTEVYLAGEEPERCYYDDGLEHISGALAREFERLRRLQP